MNEPASPLSRCMVNSLPKSGTHLLSKIVAAIPGMEATDLHLMPDKFANAPFGEGPSGEGSDALIPVGVGNPRLVKREEIRRYLRKLNQGIFGTAHTGFSPEMAGLFEELQIKTLLIIRDPRDVVVSHAHYIASRPPALGIQRHVDALTDYYQSLPLEERITTSIQGMHRKPDGSFLRNIRERLKSVLGWTTQTFNYTTSFERLVGPAGGGTREGQLLEIQSIAAHLGVALSEPQREEIATRSHGETATFRRGVIGTWREHFTGEHKRLCKELLGDLLIDLGYERDLFW